MSSSPTKERESSRPGPGSKGLKSRDNSYGTPPAYSTEIEEVGSRSGMGDGSRRRKDEKSNGGSGKKERSGRENHRDKPDLSFDVIDRLDISGLYGGGGSCPSYASGMVPTQLTNHPHPCLLARTHSSRWAIRCCHSGPQQRSSSAYGCLRPLYSRSAILKQSSKIIFKLVCKSCRHACCYGQRRWGVDGQ